MALKHFTSDFVSVGLQDGLRLDFGYRYFFDYKKGKVFPSDQLISLREIFTPLNSPKVKKGLLDNEEILLDIGNIERRFNNLINYEVVEEVGSDKIVIEKGDLVIPRLQPQMGNIFLNSEHKRFLGSTEFVEYKISSSYNPLFLYYLITSKQFLNDLARLESGKTHRRVNPRDLLKIKIPLIPKSQQDAIVAQIEPLEKEIKQLKNQLKDPQEIINKVFAREFGFDENLYKEFGKGMTAGTQIAPNRNLRIFEIDFAEFATSNILRFSTRFHNPPTKKLMHILNTIGTLKVKDILLEPIHRGLSPKYNPDGEIPVIKTGHLKNGYIEISQEEFVDTGFYKSSIRSQVKQGDILIASTGKVSLGKIDLLEEDRDLVADSHISIIRIDEKKYSRQFFTYFFRSILGYFQVERDFTGSTNQIELYANEISNFRIPNIPLTQQQKIVDEIKTELDEQERVKAKIQELRDKIDQIIEKAIQN